MKVITISMDLVIDDDIKDSHIWRLWSRKHCINQGV